MVFQAQQFLPVPVETVFLFFADPHNLLRITPPAMKPRLERLELVSPTGAPPNSSLAGAGSLIVLSAQPLPLPFRRTWVARILEFEWNRYFLDVQEQGPFRRWRHRHSFAAGREGGRDGAWLRDHVEFETGWGRAVDAFACRRLAAMFGYRGRATGNALGA